MSVNGNFISLVQLYRSLCGTTPKLQQMVPRQWTHVLQSNMVFTQSDNING